MPGQPGLPELCVAAPDRRPSRRSTAPARMHTIPSCSSSLLRVCLSPLCAGLAQNRYLDDPAFLRFLTYLQYWRRPEYAVFVTYPNCLQFLDLLQTPSSVPPSPTPTTR